METIDPYSLCPCGSGKKYKFCCARKRREREAQERGPVFWSVSPVEGLFDEAKGSLSDADLAAEIAACTDGLKLMAACKFDEAIPYFRTAVAYAPVVYTAANNLALCLFATGKLDEALRVQNESRAVSPFPNPFGWANCATFLYVRGDEDGAQRALDQALGAEISSADACVKVCETLARFRRHQTILEVADKSGYGGESAIRYFTGVASANLGDRFRAERDLRRVSIGHPLADRVRCYLQHLREGTSPLTVQGDWPYLTMGEICPGPLFAAEFARDPKDWLARRIGVDVCEAVMNEAPDRSDTGAEALAHITHPAVVALLWKIARGTFGPDHLRMTALLGLMTRGEIDPRQRIEVFMDGKRREITLTGSKLNPDFRFCEPLPSELDAIYSDAVMAGAGAAPDWSVLGKVYQKVMSKVPDFYPARFNYAVSLYHRNRKKEAERIVRELVEKHPEYLFARAALLQRLIDGRNTKESDELVESYVAPTETHPDAMVAWILALIRYHEQRGEFETASRYAAQAHQISPKHHRVKAIWESYKNWGASRGESDA